jgi:hypothetical protein
MPSMLNTAEDAVYYANLEIDRLREEIERLKVMNREKADLCDSYAVENDRLQATLQKIAKHPYTPHLIRRYATEALRPPAEPDFASDDRVDMRTGPVKDPTG